MKMELNHVRDVFSAPWLFQGEKERVWRYWTRACTLAVHGRPDVRQVSISHGGKEYWYTLDAQGCMKMISKVRECAVCLAGMEEGTCRLACNHQFHVDCLAMWERRCCESGRVVTCPECRA
jgi:hypothetical protein